MATYIVVREQDGAIVGSDVDLDTARHEVARLNAESRVVVEEVAVGAALVTRYASMFMGEPCRYEIRSADGLVVK